VKELAEAVNAWVNAVSDRKEPENTASLAELIAGVIPEKFTVGRLVKALMGMDTDRNQACELLEFFAARYETTSKKREMKAFFKVLGETRVEEKEREAAARAQAAGRGGEEKRSENDLRKYGVRAAPPPEYDGRPGGCAQWVRKITRFLEDRHVPEEGQIPLVRAQTGQQGWDEFNRLLDECGNDLDAALTKFTKIKDIGRRDELIKKEMRMTQGQEETAVQFYNKWQATRDELKAYGEVTDVDRFIAKLRNGSRVRVSEPDTLEKALQVASWVQEGFTAQGNSGSAQVRPRRGGRKGKTSGYVPEAWHISVMTGAGPRPERGRLLGTPHEHGKTISFQSSVV